MGWLDGAGGAGGSGGAGEALQVERNEEGFAFDAGENKIRGVGSAGCGGSVHAGLGNAWRGPLLQFVAKGGNVLAVFRERVTGDYGLLAATTDASHALRSRSASAPGMTTL